MSFKKILKQVVSKIPIVIGINKVTGGKADKMLDKAFGKTTNQNQFPLLQTSGNLLRRGTFLGGLIGDKGFYKHMRVPGMKQDSSKWAKL